MADGRLVAADKSVIETTRELSMAKTEVAFPGGFKPLRCPFMTVCDYGK